MKKRSSICNFIILTVLVLLLLVFSFISVRVPTTNYIFKGFFNAIPNGIEYDGGVMAIYDIETLDAEDNLDSAIEKAMHRVQDLLSKDYNETVVSRVGDKIKVVVPDKTISRNYTVGFVEFATEQVKEGSDFVAKLNGSHIKKAQYMSANGTATVYIEFTDEGKNVLKELTSSATSSSPVTLYVYVDKKYDTDNSYNYYSAVSVEGTVENGFIQLSGGSTITTKAAATAFANKIESGTIGVNMTIDGEEMSVSPVVNKDVVIISEVLLLLIVVCSIVYLVLKYKELGLVASLNTVIFATLTIVALSLTTLVELSSATLLAVIISYIVVFVNSILFIENIKNEYENGKKFIPAFKSGYVKTIPMMIDIYSVMFGLSILGLWLANGALKSFAVVFLFTSLIGAFMMMLMFRGLTKLYLNINNYDAKKVNFKKAEQANEQE